MTKSRVLIVDDEVELLGALGDALADADFDVARATSGPDGLRLLEEREFDLLLSDLMMPGMDGVELLRRALEIDPHLVAIIMTGQGTIPTAVAAMKAGAFDYLLKPFNLSAIMPTLNRAVEVRRLRRENTRLRQYVQHLVYESPRFELVGSSPAMRAARRLLEKIAPTDSSVLIQGPSGTGKELVARALHYNSPRRDRALVTINCAAMQETLLESELFGHEKGAFTGAHSAKAGLIEVADGGTLFIDEVGEMAPALQAKMLRALEDGHYRRVGGTQERHANVRVIAATNKSLEEARRAGRFREDLFYRLNVVGIDLVPLKQRREDVPALVEHFLKTRPVGHAPRSVAPEALRALMNHDWPGNVRELANVLERAQILAEGDEITLDDLPDSLRQVTPVDEAAEPLNLTVLERRALQAALRESNGNKARAARALGVSRRALYRLLEKHALSAAATGEHAETGG